jgi:hypothetical protein
MTLELTPLQLIMTEKLISADIRKKWRDSLAMGNAEFWSKEIDQLADVMLKIENYWRS